MIKINIQNTLISILTCTLFFNPEKVHSQSRNADQKENSVNCSVILEGIQAGNVSLDFYNSVCQFATQEQKIKDALISGNIKLLKSIELNDENISFINYSLQDVKTAEAFFEKLKHPLGTNWLSMAIVAGLDPNSISKTLRTKSRSLLYYAIKNRNVEAAITLLKGGASPHMYTSLWGNEAPLPILIDPVRMVESVPISRENKFKIIKAMIEAGLVWRRSKKRPTGFRRKFNEELDQFEEARHEKYDRILKKVYPNLDENLNNIENRVDICENISKNNKHDWCAEEKNVPVYIGSPSRRRHPMYKVLVGNLLAVYEDRMYLLAYYSSYNWSERVGIVIVDKGLDRIELYRHIGNGIAGMGHCSRLRARVNGISPGDYIASDRNAKCWKREVLKRDLGSDQYTDQIDLQWRTDL